MVAGEALGLLLDKVYQDGRYDFRGYRSGTVVRRLERRLYATGVRSYQDYIGFLEAHPEEYARLANYLTITVSDFFRSRYAFAQVARLVLPELVSNRINQGRLSLRLWSAGCARGEEPYSIAILLAEFLGARRQDFDISIYATDINQPALEAAEAGIYSSNDMANLPPNLREGYFTPVGEAYGVRAEIKRMVHFAYFDLAATGGPPFTDLDLIFCCNVLIYFQKQLQESLLGRLCDGLATPGYLVLGEVETPTCNLRGRLDCLDTKAKIYKKNTGGDYV
ncbi:MAG: protein-glutamate O-methyltransferase CheR [Dehalococcoidales bacterium]|nr:protein-glutamate O-methyltransferase CheR [Dehalococcoidales bacterium]